MTVLRYPGGKTRAVNMIQKYLPHTGTIYSPFFGGGAVELHMASAFGIKIVACDNFEPLINFWICTQKNPDKVKQYASEYYPISRERYREAEKTMYNRSASPYRRASALFVINRSSYYGRIRGGFSAQHRFTVSSIDRLTRINLENLSFSPASDWLRFIKKVPKNGFLFLDPPYFQVGQQLYGTNNSCFDHAKLAAELLKRKRWILCYNDDPYIRQLYSGCVVRKVSWAYGCGAKKSSEVLIMPRTMM